MSIAHEFTTAVEPKVFPNLSIDRAGYFITQVAEQFPRGKLSCSLTTQLNASIAVESITTSTALEVQDELCHNPLYDRYWSSGCDSVRNPEGRAWIPRDWLTRLVLLEHMGVELTPGLNVGGPTNHRNLLEALEWHIRNGAAAYVSGRSAVANHARLVFSPLEVPHKIFVHDPNYVETTGLYDYSDLLSFSSSGLPIAYYPPKNVPVN